ncbi:MAG: hypothetical protein AAFR16_00625 [Pseudomonadota bacterium]
MRERGEGGGSGTRVILFGALAALALIVGLANVLRGGGGEGGALPYGLGDGGDWAPEKAEQVLYRTFEPGFADGFQKVKALYPADYAAFLERLAEAAARADSVEGFRAEAGAFLQALAAEKIAALPHAPQPALARFFANRAEVFAFARDQIGAELCARMAREGMGVIGRHFETAPVDEAVTQAFTLRFTAASFANFDAYKAGEDAPRRVLAAPGPNDWAALVAAMRAAGASDAQIGAIGAPGSAADADLCAASAALLAALADLEGAPAETLRPYFAQRLAEGEGARAAQPRPR